jgi:hypothetical protein
VADFFEGVHYIFFFINQIDSEASFIFLSFLVLSHFLCLFGYILMEGYAFYKFIETMAVVAAIQISSFFLKIYFSPLQLTLSIIHVILFSITRTEK